MSSERLAAANRVYEQYALAAPGANTTFPTVASGGIKFSNRASRARVFVSLTTASVLNYTVTDGTTAYVIGLNNSVALAAGDSYEFEFDVGYSVDGSEAGTRLTYGFQLETDGVVRQIIVTEITGPA